MHTHILTYRPHLSTNQSQEHLRVINASGRTFGADAVDDVITAVAECESDRLDRRDDVFGFLRSPQCHLLPDPQALTLADAENVVAAGGADTLTHCQQLETEERALDSLSELTNALASMHGGAEWRRQRRADVEAARLLDAERARVAELESQRALADAQQREREALEERRLARLRDGKGNEPVSNEIDDIDAVSAAADGIAAQQQQAAALAMTLAAHSQTTASAASLHAQRSNNNGGNHNNSTANFAAAQMALSATAAGAGTVMLADTAAMGVDAMIPGQLTGAEIVETIEAKDRTIMRLQSRLDAILAHWEAERMLPQKSLLLTESENHDLRGALTTQRQRHDSLLGEIEVLEASKEHLSAAAAEEQNKTDAALSLHEETRKKAMAIIDELRRTGDRTAAQRDKAQATAAEAFERLEGSDERVRQLQADVAAEGRAKKAAELMHEETERARAAASQAADASLLAHRDQCLRFLLSPLAKLMRPGKLHEFQTGDNAGDNDGATHADRGPEAAIAALFSRGGAGIFTLAHLNTLNTAQRRFASVDALAPAVGDLESQRLTARDALLYWLAGPALSPLSDCHLLDGSRVARGGNGGGGGGVGMKDSGGKGSGSAVKTKGGTVAHLTTADGDRLQIAGGERTFQHLKELNAAGRRFADVSQLTVAVMDLEQTALHTDAARREAATTANERVVQTQRETELVAQQKREVFTLAAKLATRSQPGHGRGLTHNVLPGRFNLACFC
jgi:hypothetical protein